MTPNQLHRYRQETSKRIPLQHDLQRCPECKVRRSVAQFEDGHAACKKCRGVK